MYYPGLFAFFTLSVALFNGILISICSFLMVLPVTSLFGVLSNIFITNYFVNLFDWLYLIILKNISANLLKKLNLTSTGIVLMVSMYMLNLLLQTIRMFYNISEDILADLLLLLQELIIMTAKMSLFTTIVTKIMNLLPKPFLLLNLSKS